ncbi:efflux RND transporter permease subunit [Psychromonas aquimarina]|uniref:efflux RND transporter permease subunit n=1 Tax=Psychromonas aquimarina TaxID=444919 RepID=UPI0004067CB0|nr:efflux RND transporter permease subunit [Psychromonas aquimarina]
MKWLTKWFLDNPVGANLLMLAIIVGGVLSAGRLRVESFPQIEPSSLIISAAYPGGTARQIDDSITQRIEEAISGLSGIKQVTSESTEGMATVRVRKTSKRDLNRLIEDVRNRINSIDAFPEQAERPQVYRDEFSNLAAFVIVSGDRLDSELQPVARQVELALKKHPEISSVANWGANAPLLVIEPDQAQLRNYGLSLAELAARIEQMSLQTRSGEIKSQRGRMILRGDGYADNLQRLGQIEVIASPSGSIKLSDVASISRQYEASDSIVRNNGQTAIALLVSTSKQDNLLDVSRAVQEVLEKERARLPDDISLSVMADMAPYIKDQLNRLGDNAWQGLLIILVLLGLFLDLKLAFWVAVGIPVALCGTFAAMGVMNYSLNDITLFGFILVLGILVDDAVVVGESIHSARSRYKKPADAAWYGVKSVSVATVFGVLTTIAAFSPMLWIDNELAKLLAGFSAVVIFALLFSLIESKFILPAHLAAVKPKSTKAGRIEKVQAKAQAGLTWFNLSVYEPLLRQVLRNKGASFITFFALVVLAYGLWSKGVIRSAVFPDIPGRYITAKVNLQDGAPPALQAKAAAQLEKAALSLDSDLKLDHQLDENPISNLLVWSDGEGEIEATAELTSEALTKLPNNLLLNKWKVLSGDIEGVYSARFSAGEELGGGLSITLSSDDRKLAILAAQSLTARIEAVAGVNDVYHDGQGGMLQIRLKLNEFGTQLGLTQSGIAQIAGGAFGQREVHRLLQRGQETKVIIRYSRDKKSSVQQLLNSPFILSSGKSILLADVVKVSYEQEPEQLYRRNREQVVNLYWRQDRDIQSPEMTLEQLAHDFVELERTYPGVSIKAAGEFDEIGEVQSGFKSAMILTLLLIYALLAIPLKSYWQPFIIMSVIPFGFAGAIFGHGVMNMPISILSMFGMMAMTGIVINDSLVLITRFNDYHRSGMPLNEALIKAGKNRLRAIFLTTVTTVCGLLPLLSDSSEQAQYLKPAAVSLVFGELFATSVTLLLIPLLLGVFCRDKLPLEQGEEHEKLSAV